MKMTAVNSLRLTNQVFVIIGGTAGLGLSAAQACVAAGASVVVVGRDATKAAEFTNQFPAQVQIIEGDATDAATAERAIRRAVDVFNGCNGLYHVAGGSGRSRGDGPLNEVSDEGWDYTLRLNLDSVFYSNRAALRHFLGSGQGGVILNMASVLGFSPSPRFFATHAYAAAKAAIIGLTRSSAAYYAPHNIRINAVAPALVETPMARRALQDETILQFIRKKQPLDGGRVGRPEDLDEAVVYLLSDESRFITGQVLAIDGGWSVTDASGT